LKTGGFRNLHINGGITMIDTRSSGYRGSIPRTLAIMAVVAAVAGSAVAAERRVLGEYFNTTA
jgi:hypothetical protein